MDASITSILEALGETIKREVMAANGRASAAEAKLSHLVAGLSSLITGDPVNDVAAPASVTVPYRSKRERHTERLKSVPDGILLATLCSAWMGSRQIMNTLHAEGHKIAEGTVYNRMRKLARNYSNVESATKPERWRLNETDSNSNAAPAVKQSTGYSAAANSRLNRGNAMGKAGQSTASNDNLIVHEPVLHHGACLEVMSSMPDQSVDLILADLPYGVTGLKIDIRIDMDGLWAEYRRIIKPTGNIVLFGSQPFTTALVNAAPDMFKYSLVWEKTRGTGYLHCHDKPIKTHEDVLIFTPGTTMRKQRSARRATFNPVGASTVTKTLTAGATLNYLNTKTPENGRQYEGLINCPRSVLKFPKDVVPRGKGHPFAKPVALLEHLIRSYSDPGEVVLDNTMGGGSTCVAAMRSGRRAIGIEQDVEWFNSALERVNAERGRPNEDNETSTEGTDRLSMAVVTPFVDWKRASQSRS